MRVTSLKLVNVRAIKTAEFRFQPGFNLIVGVNGVGKSTVLDALSVCLSAVVKRANELQNNAKALSADDIRIGADVTMVECHVRIGTHDYIYLRHRPRQADRLQKAQFIGESPSPVSSDESRGRPLAVHFSTNRAVPSRRTPGKGVALGGVNAAFADNFAKRELRLGEFGAWLKVQRAMRTEHPAADSMLTACQDAVERFLPGYANLRLSSGNRPQLQIDRDTTTIPVRQLSDGERGILALVLDLTRRLAQANPNFIAPASEAEAVVLIDEIDLHLHPKWQRQIVQKLTTTFPRCQFIATTHSPQVIGEVGHNRIQIIANGEVYSPTHSFGVDSSRVLEEIMDAPPRSPEIAELLTKVSQEVDRQRYENARGLLAQLVSRVGEDDPEVTRIRTLLDFLEGEE